MRVISLDARTTAYEELNQISMHHSEVRTQYNFSPTNFYTQTKYQRTTSAENTELVFDVLSNL